MIRRQAETQRQGEQPAEPAHDDGGEQGADDGKDAAYTRSDIWNLPQTDRGYWLVCRYANTTVILSRQLPATVTRCEPRPWTRRTPG